jgi:acyl-CoA synthetase (AMP-forming)/AMP-acid ligase II
MYPGKHAIDRCDQAALILEPSGRKMTFAEFDANANRLAHLFRKAGLRRGDHIAIFMENNLRYCEVMSAAERTGLYYTCVNSFLTSAEVAFIVDDCDAKVFVTSVAKSDVALKAASLTPKVSTFLCVDAAEPIGPFLPYDSALSPFAPTHVSGEQLGAAMLYSSGTTGRPKGILRPLPDSHPREQLPVMTFAQQLLGMREGMVYLSPAPTYHSAPQASIATALRLGSTCVIMERFDPELLLELVERHKVTHTNMVPTMFNRLLKLPKEVRTRYDVSSLEAVAHTAAPCPVPVKKAMIEWWGPILREYYGSTEANGFTFCDSGEWLEHPGTVGRAIYGRLLVVDENEKPLEPGVVGTVWFEGATNFTYYKDEGQTAAGRDPSGQRSTVGDVGYLDEQGYLYLTDRKTHMIISGGVNVYPQEVENLLVTHPKVLDAAVFGVPNADLGEEVKAAIQLVDGHSPSPDLERELIEFCRDNLAHYKCPRSVDFEPELPRLPTGKLYKRLLRDRYWGDATSRIVSS